VRIDFDPDKNLRNIRERGLSFERAAEFDFATATVEENIRKTYPEVRYVAVGFLGVRLHVMCFCPSETGIRVISFRKAKAPTKVATTIRLSPDVVQTFKASGRGWQTRIDAALKDWLRTHSPA
jgi:uncharacterized DUF497 family protein